MKEKLEEILGKEKIEDLQKYLERKGLNITTLYGIEAKERIELITDYCNATNQEFSKIYGAIESAKDKIMKEHTIRSAVSAILARDGPAAVSDPKLYERIEEEMKKYNK